MKISRREFLKHAALCSCSAAAWGVFPRFGLNSAFASTGNGTKVLFLNMNGGWDGLAVMQPVSGSVFDMLSSFRPTLIQDPSTLLSLDGNYSLHPQLTVLKEEYDAGKMLSILNVGYDNMSRSHADAEIAYARGVPDRLNASASGFINRMGSEFGWTSLQAVSVSGNHRSFEGGSYRGTEVNSLSEFRFQYDNSQSYYEGDYRRDLIYSVASDSTVDPSKPKQKDVVDAIDLTANTVSTIQSALSNATYVQTYPNTSIGRQFRDVDVLFSTSGIGAEVAYIRSGGFDTHSSQATTLDSLLSRLNAALDVFISNMKGKGIWDNLIIVVFSEFGRTNRENGSTGTDHGGALPVFLIGGPVNGGIVGSVTTSDLNSYGWLPMRYNVVEIYRRILMRMNYDPDKIFAVPSGATLPGIFNG